MGKGRLEAFSDGVLAIIITIMVLELKIPHGSEVASLQPLLPTFLSYILSFVYLAIYWNNHHHLLHTIKETTGSIMWANMHLLFWLSLVPFATGWMGENNFAGGPVALYGVVLLMAAFAYLVLQTAIIHKHGRTSVLAVAIGADWKGKLSPLMYVVAIACSGWLPLFSGLLYLAVALIWLVPDRRIERALAQQTKSG